MHNREKKNKEEKENINIYKASSGKKQKTDLIKEKINKEEKENINIFKAPSGKKQKTELIMWLLCKNKKTAAIAFTFQHAESKLSLTNWAQYCFQSHVLRISYNYCTNHPIRRALNLYPKYVHLYLNNKKCYPFNCKYPHKLFIAFLDIESDTQPPSKTDLRKIANYIGCLRNRNSQG